MQTIKRFLGAALIAAAWLSGSTNASAQITYDRVNTNEWKQVHDNHNTLGGYRVGSMRNWERFSDRDRLWTLTDNELYVRLFEGTKTITRSQIDAMAERNKTVGRPVSAGGYIQYMGNRVLTADTAFHASDVLIDRSWQTSTGTITFYEESKAFGLFPLWSVKLRVFGRLNNQISAWAHTTGFPQQTGESDFSITQVNIDGQVTVRGTISGPSGSVVGGELRPLSGKLGGVSSAQRHFIPGPWGSSSTRFTLQASTPATASIFSGVMNVRPGGGQNQEIAYWGQPWRFETEMAPTATKVANIDGSF